MGGMTEPTNNDFPTAPLKAGDGEPINTHSGVDETQPVPSSQEGEDAGYADTLAIPSGGQNGELPESKPEIPPGKTIERSISTRLVAFLGILALVVIAGLSAYLGYSSGIRLRTQAESSAAAVSLQIGRAHV